MGTACSVIFVADFAPFPESKANHPTIKPLICWSTFIVNLGFLTRWLLFFKHLLKRKMSCLKIELINSQLPHSSFQAGFYLFDHLSPRDALFFTQTDRGRQNLPQGSSPFLSPGLLFYLLLTCCIALYHWLFDSPAPVSSHALFRSETHHCICSTRGLPPACLLTYSCVEALRHMHSAELYFNKIHLQACELDHCPSRWYDGDKMYTEVCVESE